MPLNPRPTVLPGQIVRLDLGTLPRPHGLARLAAKPARSADRLAALAQGARSGAAARAIVARGGDPLPAHALVSAAARGAARGRPRGADAIRARRSRATARRMRGSPRSPWCMAAAAQRLRDRRRAARGLRPFRSGTCGLRRRANGERFHIAAPTARGGLVAETLNSLADAARAARGATAFLRDGGNGARHPAARAAARPA